MVVRAGQGPSGIGVALWQLEAGARRPGRFGVLVDARPAGDERAPRSGRVEQVRQLRALRPAMTTRSLGVAFVTAPEALAGQRRRLRAARLMLGCPVEVFDSEEPALRWLRDRGVGGPA